jgi:hypothetical protein
MIVPTLLSPKHGALLFSMLLGIFYVVIPTFVYVTTVADILYLKTAAMALLAIVSVSLGRKLPLIDLFQKARLPRAYIKSSTTIVWAFILFFIFAMITTLTAPSIPLLSALGGGVEIGEIDAQRGAFLKGREGAWIALLYIASIMMSTLLPYCVVLSICTQSPMRTPLIFVFLMFSILFVVKVLFLNLVLPIVAYLAASRQLSTRVLVSIVIAALGLLASLIYVSGYGTLEGTTTTSPSEYWSSAYTPQGSLDFALYRAFSVPVFSVVDTLHVHESVFQDRALLGTTSSLLASAFGVEKVNIERHVFEYQYGGWNEIANSNVAFFVDGYINFGWLGVIAFGIIVGQLFRMLATSPDAAVNSLSLLLSFQLLSSPLIQMLFSNGWILVCMWCVFVRIRYYPAHT